MSRPRPAARGDEAELYRRLSAPLERVVRARRGARYGLPGWVGQQERKSGEPKAVYLDRGEAYAKAREFLAAARTAADLAGRQLVLLILISLPVDPGRDSLDQARLPVMPSSPNAIPPGTTDPTDYSA